MRFNIELLTTLDKEKISCLMTNTFKSIFTIGKAVVAAVGKKAGRILGPWVLSPFVWCSGFACEPKKMLS